MIGTLLLLTDLALNLSNNVFRYAILPDPHDTTSWNDAHVLTADTSYQAVFKRYDDVDYYKFTSSYLRSVAVLVNSPNQQADIEIYKNSTSNLVASYNNLVSFNYDSFSNYLVSMGPSELIFIKVSANSDASNYTITVNTNPNLSDVSILRDSNGSKPTHYYGVQPYANQIDYYIDYSCNVTAGYGIKTYRDAYTDAIFEWGNVGDVVLNIVSNPNDADVVLYASDISNFNNDYIICDADVYGSWFFGWTYKFDCTQVKIIDDWNEFGYFESYETYLAIVSVCIQSIGMTLGLERTDFERNFMMHPSYSCTLTPYNAIGDGDVASYIYIYG